MSTRGFISFVIDGQVKTAYNHFDSYPGGLGQDILNWLRSGPVDPVAVRALRVVTDDTPPTPADAEQLRPYADLEVSTRRLDEWYVLLRKTQGDPAAMLKAGVIENAANFPCDSLFAEWGYVIDLDAQVFEVYEGFQRSPHSAGRFASLKPVKSGYYPVALKASWPLDSLPGDAAFMAATEGQDDES